MGETLLHLLGYLTEKQWLSAFGSPQISKSKVADCARKVCERYNMEFESEKLVKLIKSN